MSWCSPMPPRTARPATSPRWSASTPRPGRPTWPSTPTSATPTWSGSSRCWRGRSARWCGLADAGAAWLTRPGRRGLAGGQAEEQFVDDAGGELAVERSVRGLLLGQDGAGQGEQRDLDVGVGAQLAGGDAAADDGPDGVVPRPDHRLLVPRHQPRVLLPLAEEQRVAARLARVGAVRAH